MPAPNPSSSSALTITVQPDLVEPLRAALARDGGPADRVRVVAWDLQEDLPEDAGPVDVVVVPNQGMRTRHLQRLRAVPGLRVVQLASAGFEHAQPHVPAGVALCNGRGVHDAGTAELAMALLLASQRGIDDAVRAMPEGRWSPGPRSSLADRRVLVLGYGSIGAALGRRLEAFEVDVVRVASRPRDEPEGHVHGVDELPDLLPRVDAVVVVLPLTPQTEGLVDARLLALLPDDALVVNVGRGKVVDTDALVAELEAGRLRAALDVTDPEPLPADHPLWRAPRTILTPHVGGYTDATTPRLVALLDRQVRTLVDGGEPLNVVARP